MSDSVYRVMEVIGSSAESWETGGEERRGEGRHPPRGPAHRRGRRVRHEDRRQGDRRLPDQGEDLLQVPRDRVTRGRAERAAQGRGDAQAAAGERRSSCRAASRRRSACACRLTRQWRGLATAADCAGQRAPGVETGRRGASGRRLRGRGVSCAPGLGSRWSMAAASSRLRRPSRRPASAQARMAAGTRSTAGPPYSPGGRTSCGVRCASVSRRPPR